MTIPELEEQLRQRDAQIKAQATRIKELERKIEESKKLLVEKVQSKEAKPPKEVTRNPDNRQYARFLKSLFVVYYNAVRASRDRRLSAGRPVKVKKLQSRIRMICRRYGEMLDDAVAADGGKFVRLQNELVGGTEKLFVFVLHPEVEATNNRSERQARSEAMARKAARTSKTERGAKRRGVIMSVLASLSKRLEHFALGIVLSEINHWLETGQSVFRAELARLPLAVVPP
jgi:hypothetical protein